MLPKLLTLGGPMAWILIFTSAVALAVFLERMLHYHRAQINSLEFLDGVRNVLRQGNVVEGLSICDATPGPVARLVKAALLSRERGREGVREALEEAGMQEVPKLEEPLGEPSRGGTLRARCRAHFKSAPSFSLRSKT